jgi:drug/metabolite transporter (DMT)-like permease
MPQALHSRALAVPSLLFGATLWGLIWYPYRVLNDAGVGGIATAFLTYLLPLLLCGAFSWRHLARARGQFGWLALLGLASGWTNVAYVLAVIEGEVMRVVLLFYLAPVWTVFLSRWLLGETLNARGWAIMTVSIAGALVMLWPPGGGLPLPANHAEWIALSAGMSFALSNVMTRKADAADEWAKAHAVWAGVGVVAGIGLLLGNAPFAFVTHAHLATWLLVLGVGVCIGTMTLAVQYGLTHTPANQAIIIMLFELVAAALSSWWLSGETLGAREWLGAAMIVAASLVSGQIEKSPVLEQHHAH